MEVMKIGDLGVLGGGERSNGLVRFLSGAERENAAVRPKNDSEGAEGETNYGRWAKGHGEIAESENAKSRGDRGAELPVSGWE